MKKFDSVQKLAKCDTETRSEQCCWKNGADRLVHQRAATGLQFVKNAIYVKHNKMRYVCIKTFSC